MKRLFFFIIGLIFFIWLLMTAVKFVMNTSFYQRIANIPSPLSSQAEEKKSDDSNTLNEAGSDSFSGKNISNQEKNGEKPSETLSSSAFPEFTAGVRGAEGIFYLFGEEEKNREDALYALLSKLENANSFSVENALKNAENPEETMKNILSDFEKLRGEGEQELAQLTAEEEQLLAEIEEGDAQLQELEEEFFVDLNAGDKQKSDALFDEYVALKKALVEKKARLGQVQTLLKRLRGLMNTLANKIGHFATNEQALLCGIEVPDFSVSAPDLTGDISTNMPQYIPEFTIGAPRLGEGYILGESTAVPIAANISTGSGNQALPAHLQDLRVPQLYEDGWNTHGMEGKYWSEVDYIDVFFEGSQIN